MENLNDSVKVAKLFQEVMHLFKQSMSKVFEDTGITVPQSMVIGILSKEKTLKISELSNKLGLSNSTISGIIDRLEKQAIVERVRSSDDKRVVYVSLLPKFEEMHRSFNKITEKYFLNVMNKGAPEDIYKIIDGLNTLKRLLSI